ncbi:DUF1839 family protein [Ktedonospora formicarum]|nr:DUF1839 family protein [Ktedonospora formicarum]
MKHVVQNINVEGYMPHWLHDSTNHWPQSNCYMDLWIEILHTLGLNPLAALAFTVAIDFEGDQWTFFKFPLHDLFLLYGIDVQELNIWHSLLEQVCEQASRNRMTLVEVDAFYLPDVSDTNYHQAHEKTTIGIQSIDPEARQLGYFHNSGYYTLQGDDFAGIFQQEHATALPPYVEFAKLDRVEKFSEASLALQGQRLLADYIKRLPTHNPFHAYSQHFEEQLAALPNLPAYHQYAFATLRQYGACFNYTSHFLDWVGNYRGLYMKKAAKHFDAISSRTQTFLLRAARVVRNKKPLDHAAYFAEIAEHWELGMQELQPVLHVK